MARERCAAALAALGFETRELSFVYSSFPGRLGTPLFGAATIVLVGLAGRYGTAGHRWLPTLVLVAGASFMLVAGTWMARRGVLAFPLMREPGTNLVATRPGEAPRVWLCAHLDSKSQPIPTFVRSAGVVFMAVGYLLMLLIAMRAAGGAEPTRFSWALAAFLTLLGAIPVLSSIVGARSPGALDNASGVAAVVEAARLLQGIGDVGVLITDAEELGMAGARAWCAARPPDEREETVLNCDGVDDHGHVAVMYTGRRPATLLAAAATAARESGITHEAMRMIPGVLTDSVAFTDAGLPSVTFMRGSVRSFLRVHRPSDNLSRLRGTGIAETAALMASTARVLLRPEAT